MKLLAALHGGDILNLEIIIIVFILFCLFIATIVLTIFKAVEPSKKSTSLDLSSRDDGGVVKRKSKEKFLDI